VCDGVQLVCPLLFLISHNLFTEPASMCSSFRAPPQEYAASCISI